MYERQPAVAGLFYPGDSKELSATVNALLLAAPAGEERRVFGVVSPHAGYVYSGAIAGAAFGSVRVPDVAIVIAPNHTGLGARAAIISEGAFVMPGGAVPIDARLAADVRDVCGLTEDSKAHLREHALEVQLPLLRARNPRVRIVPIVLGMLPFDTLVRIGHGIAGAVHAAGGDVLLVASTDMSHYIPAKEAEKLDRLALDCVERLDARGLYDVVMERDLSMCGFIPTTTVLLAAKELGATRATLVRYGSSGDVTGDNDRVVGYASLLIT